MRIGDSPPRAALLPVGPPKVCLEKSTEPSVDVLDVVYPNSTPEVVKAGAKMAGKGLLGLGLPALGAVLAGPAGLFVGLAASATSEFSTSKGPNRLRNSLMIVGLSGAIATAGLLLGPVASLGFVAATAVLPGLLAARKQAQKEPVVTIQPEPFARHYLTKVNAALADAKSELATAVPTGWASSKLCADAVLQGFQLAVTQLPSGAALAFAGETARELLTTRDLERFDEALLEVVARQGKLYEDRQPLSGAQGLIQVEMADNPSPAFAANQVVLVDKKFALQTDQVTQDFVVGHELSHIRHKDAAFKQGVKTLNELISVASAPGNLTLGLVKVILEGMLAEESRSMEFRADREGRDYALAQGHSSEAVEQAAGKLFAQAPKESNWLDSHPAGPDRIQALSKPISQGSATP